ncbi:hypothetical protein D3C84_795440 [compost metagenome]
MNTDHGFKAPIGGGLEIHLFSEFHQQVAHNGLENCGQELLLVAEVVVERSSFNAHFLGKISQCHRFIAVFGNELHPDGMNGLFGDFSFRAYGSHQLSVSIWRRGWLNGSGSRHPQESSRQ